MSFIRLINIAVVCVSLLEAQQIRIPGPGGAAPAAAVISLVAHVGARSAAGGNITTGAVNTTGATFLIVNAAYLSSSITISDSKSNTWTPLTSKTNTGGNDCRLFYVANPTVGSGHTFTASNGTNAFQSLEALAFSGVATTTPFDSQQNGTSNGAGLTIQTGTVTPANANSLVVAGSGWSAGSSGGTSINLGFTIQDTQEWISGQNYGSTIAWLVQPGSATAVNPTITFVNGEFSCAVIASFHP